MDNAKVTMMDGSHNAAITPRTAILIPASGADNDGLVIELGKAGPRVIEFEPGTPSYAEWGLQPFQSVREFTDAFMRDGTPEYMEMNAAVSPKSIETWRGLLQLRASQIATDDTVGKQALSRAGTSLLDDPRLRKAFVDGHRSRLAPWFYPAFVNRELKDTKLVLWLTKRSQFVPAIFCPNMRAALFAATAFRRIAACPNCKQLFALDSERADGGRGERYCTALCGQRYRQRMYRQRLKARAKKRTSPRAKR
jgi:hypothetical protein